MKKKYIDHVVSMFNLEECREICNADFSDFAKYGTLVGNNLKEQYYFKDNGSNVLAVAHLDSVQTVKCCELLKHPAGWRIYSPSLDDRLGAYVILCLLPKLGIFPDILLTNNEESGNTTAKFFKTEKKYNWMFSFDRTGDDVVMYQYKDEKSFALLREYDFTPGYGSFSCIGSLGGLKCKGFNFGVGYHDYHTLYAYAQFGQLIHQVTKFSKFFHSLKKVHMKHEPAVETVRYSYGRGYQSSLYEEDDTPPRTTEYYHCKQCKVWSSPRHQCPNCYEIREQSFA